MAQTKPTRQTRIATAAARRAFVVHDGTAFQLAAELRDFDFVVDEGPLLSLPRSEELSPTLTILATRPGIARAERLCAWTRELCWRGTPLLAIGSAVGPVAEFFGAPPQPPKPEHSTSRLVDVTSTGQGLFAGLPREFRLALPAGDRVASTDLSAEFAVTAWSRDHELVGASHVFRPVHLLHQGALDSADTRRSILNELLRLLRDRGGRAL